MHQILANSRPLQIGQPIPSTINSLEVTIAADPFGPTLVPKEQVPLIRSWLQQLVKNTTSDYITVNGALVPKEDLPWTE